MGTLQEKVARLRRFNAWFQRHDSELAEESADLNDREVLELAPSPEVIERAVEEESIVLRRERPGNVVAQLR
jgi:hypothetical protein